MSAAIKVNDFFKAEFSGSTVKVVSQLEFGRTKVLLNDRIKPILMKDQRNIHNEVEISNSDIVIDKFSIAMTKQKFSCLKYGEWINDEVKCILLI